MLHGAGRLQVQHVLRSCTLICLGNLRPSYLRQKPAGCGFAYRLGWAGQLPPHVVCKKYGVDIKQQRLVNCLLHSSLHLTCTCCLGTLSLA